MMIYIAINNILKGSRKEYDIIEAIENICVKEQIHTYGDPFFPGELTQTCDIIRGGWDDELTTFLL